MCETSARADSIHELAENRLTGWSTATREARLRDSHKSLLVASGTGIGDREPARRAFGGRCSWLMTVEANSSPPIHQRRAGIERALRDSGDCPAISLSLLN